MTVLPPRPESDRSGPNVETLDASAHLRRFRDAGLLDQHDRGAATYYTPTERLLNPAAVARTPIAQPTEQVEKPTKLGEELHKQSGKPHKLEMPAELAAAVADLTRRTPNPELRRLIRRLCAWRELSAEELSEIIGRSRDYLRATYTGPMIRSGELEYTNPASPQDPRAVPVWICSPAALTPRSPLPPAGEGEASEARASRG